MQDQNSLLEAMRKYIEKCPFIADIDVLHIDQVDDEPISYSIQTSGLILNSEDILGNQIWQYNAILQSREYTADDLSRLNASAFTEQFIFWINDNNRNDIYPAISKGKPVRITADNGILLSLDNDGDRGVYQIQIHLIFEREGF